MPLVALVALVGTSSSAHFNALAPVCPLRNRRFHLAVHTYADNFGQMLYGVVAFLSRLHPILVFWLQRQLGLGQRCSGKPADDADAAVSARPAARPRHSAKPKCAAAARTRPSDGSADAEPRVCTCALGPTGDGTSLGQCRWRRNGRNGRNGRGSTAVPSHPA